MYWNVYAQVTIAAIITELLMEPLRYDMVIIGGGIAGLWTLAQSRSRGLNAILFEKGALGQGQTISSQGIIHGGSKYALAGSISRATSMISDMPDIWRNALNSNGSSTPACSNPCARRTQAWHFPHGGNSPA